MFEAHFFSLSVSLSLSYRLTEDRGNSRHHQVVVATLAYLAHTCKNNVCSNVHMHMFFTLWKGFRFVDDTELLTMPTLYSQTSLMKCFPLSAPKSARSETRCCNSLNMAAAAMILFVAGGWVSGWVGAGGWWLILFLAVGMFIVKTLFPPDCNRKIIGEDLP